MKLLYAHKSKKSQLLMEPMQVFNMNPVIDMQRASTFI